MNQEKIMNEFRNDNNSNKDEIHKNLWNTDKAEHRQIHFQNVYIRIEGRLKAN